MAVLAWIICLTLFGDTVAGPVQPATRSVAVHPTWTDQHEAPRPEFFLLPMFHHAHVPLVAPELLRPAPYKRPLPDGLKALLLPPTKPQRGVQETGARGVDVWCGVDKISVRVDRLQLRFWTAPSLFRLGSCQATRISPRFLYFHFGLTECDGDLKIVDGQLVYTYVLRYTPPPQDHVIRAVPLSFPIQCHYNRFHYSYQVGFRPQVQHTTFMKSMRTKVSFSLTVCNAQWEPMDPGHWFFLGEPVYFMATTGTLFAGERLYVDSCHATISEDPNSMPRLDIISNYGCMMDSRRDGSSSRFLSRGVGLLKFSVDAFLFQAASQMLYLHCSMSVGLTTSPSSKSCNYDGAAGRWKELEAPPSVCSCCDSMCTETHHSTRYTVSSPGWFTGQTDEDKPRMKKKSFQAEEGRDFLAEMVEHEEGIGELLNVQTRIEHTKEKDNPSADAADKKKWKDSSAVRLWEMREKYGEAEEVVLDELKEFTDVNIMSDQGKTQEKATARTWKQDPTPKRESASGLSTFNISADPSGVGPGTTNITITNSSYAMNDDTGGSDGNVSTAVIPCPDSGGRCSATNSAIPHAGHSTTHAAVSTQGFIYSTTSGTASDSSRVNADLESFARTHSETKDLEFDTPDAADDRQLEKSGLELNNLDSLLRSDQFKPVTKSVNTKPDREPEQAGDSVSSKGANGDEDVLHGLQLRGFKPDRSAHPAGLRDPNCVDGVLCGSGFDFGTEEGEVLHLSSFTGATNTNEELSGSSTEMHSVTDSEKIHHNSPSHSAVVAVSHLLTDRGWAEEEPQWGLQSFRFVMEQPDELMLTEDH